MSEMECMLCGDLTEDNTVRFKAFQDNLEKFKATCAQMLGEHKEARSVIKKKCDSASLRQRPVPTKY